MAPPDFPVHPQAKAGSIISADKANYRFTILTDGVIRYEWSEDGVFEDRASYFAINRDLPVPKFRHINTREELQIITERFHLTFNKQRFSPNGLFVQVLGNISDHRSCWRYGEIAKGLGGTIRTLDGVDGGVELRDSVISRRGFATIDDSNSMLFDGEGWVSPRRSGYRVDGYLFAYGLDYRASIRALFAISGSQPLLPRWALGNWWSRYYRYSADEYLALMRKFREKDIPLSIGVLDMDWHLVENEAIKKAGVSGWTGYSWNRKLFPDIDHFRTALKDMDLKVSLNDHPADGVQSYEDAYSHMCEALGLDPSTKDPIRFDITNKAFCNAFFNILHRRIENECCDFWWIDWQQGQYSRTAGIDPMWMLNHFQYSDSTRNGERSLILSQYAGPGSHRYPVGFSGDAIMSWATLGFQPEFTNAASNVGYGWWSHDIGGHANGYRDDELATRWVQYGVFSPIMRLHSADSRWASKEPWCFGGEAEYIMSKFLRLRHRLVPYLYTMNVRASTQDEPLCQPMYWYFPHINEAYSVPNQYYFGSQLIVVPITTRRDPINQRSRVRAWLPTGRYVDIFTGVVYDGDRSLWLYRRLDGYPVLAREGAIIPLDSTPTLANGCPNPSSLELLIFLGSDGEFELFESRDDKMKPVGDASQWIRTKLTYSHSESTLIINSGNQETSEASNIPLTRTWVIRFLGYDVPGAVVSVNSNEYQVHSEKVENGTIIRLPETTWNAKVVIKLGGDEVLDDGIAEAQVKSIIEDACIRFNIKDAIWTAMGFDSKSRTTQAAKIRRLHAIDMDKKLLDAILEQVIAE